MPVEAVLVEGDDDVGLGAGDGAQDVVLQLGTSDPGQEAVAVVEQRHVGDPQLAGRRLELPGAGLAHVQPVGIVQARRAPRG